MLFFGLLLNFICAGSLWAASGGIFEITEFGAKGDGKTINTEAFKKAFAECEKRGGGTVSVPPGVFVTGTIFMKSHTRLYLEPGAVIKGSTDRNDYCKIDAYPQNGESFNEKWSAGHLLVAVNVEDVSIDGQGKFDGSGDYFLADPPKKPDWSAIAWRHGFVRNVVTYKGDDPEMIRKQLRPGQLLVFCECKDVRISNVTLQNSPCWSCFVHGCANVFITGIKINNPFYFANADGIDIDCCRNVTVSDCQIVTGDDSFAIRGNPKRLLDKTKVCENIVITNCVCASASSAFRVGVGDGVIRDVLVSNIRIIECGVGIHFQSSYNAKAPKGVSISRVRFSNMNIQNAGYAFLMSPGTTIATAAIEEIVLENIYAESFAGAQILCNDNTAPKRITVRNCDFVAIDNPVKPKQVPSAFLNFKGARETSLENVTLRWKTADPWKMAFEEDANFKIKKINCVLQEPKNTKPSK